MKNVATTTSPTSSSKQSPRRSGTSTVGAALFLDLPSSLPSLCTVSVPAAHYPPVQTQGRILAYRFEQFVLRSLIGGTAEEVARRLGISAETVDRIVENQLTEDRQIDSHV